MKVKERMLEYLCNFFEVQFHLMIFFIFSNKWFAKLIVLNVKRVNLG